MVTITTSIPSQQHKSVTNTILATARQVPSLTPRTSRQLIKSLRSGNLALAFKGGKLIGWLLATPYPYKVQELGMAFVLPEYRNQGTLKRMISFLVDKRPVTLAVTYEPKIATMLADNWQFRPSSFAQFIFFTRAGFIVDRVRSPNSIRAVVSHMATARPIYLERVIEQ